MPIVRWRAVYSERGTCGSEGREPKPAGRNPVRRGCPYPITIFTALAKAVPPIHKRLPIQYGFNFPVIAGPPRRKVGAMSQVGKILWIAGIAFLLCCLSRDGVNLKHDVT